MSKVLVDREEIEAVRNTLKNGGGAVGVLRWAESILAQPAEAEGVVPVVCYLRAFQDGTPHWTEDCVCEDAVYPNHDGDETYSMPMVRQADHLAALSAVTAERDRLEAENERLARDAKNDAIAYRAVIERQEELRAEVEALRKDAERYRWLRDKTSMPGVVSSSSQVEKYFNEYMLCGEPMDNAIDAAMAAKEA